MTTEYLLYIDRGCDRWVLQYRNQSGELVVELTSCGKARNYRGERVALRAAPCYPGIQ